MIHSRTVYYRYFRVIIQGMKNISVKVKEQQCRNENGEKMRYIDKFQSTMYTSHVHITSTEALRHAEHLCRWLLHHSGLSLVDLVMQAGNLKIA